MATGIACRATSGFVTDAASDTYFLGAGDTGSGLYPLSRAGLVFGGLSSVEESRDRQAGLDVRLAGMVFNGGSNFEDFRLDVTAGNNDIKIGYCDVNNTFTITGRVYDNTTLLATAGPSSVVGDGTANSDVMGQDGTVYTTQALWSAAAATTYNISSGILIVRYGDSSASATGFLAYLQAVPTASAVQSLTSFLQVGRGYF